MLLQLQRTLPPLAAALLVACGGDNAPTSGQILGASPAGIWRGTDSTTGLAVVGLLDDVGEAEFIRSDEALFSGVLSTAKDNSISASGTAYAINRFPDGSESGSWTMQGTLKERETLSVKISVITSAGTATTGTLELTFDPLYDQPSSLASLAGGYAPPNGFPYLIESNGSFSLAILICETSGQFSIIDPAHDLYRVSSTEVCDNGKTTTRSGLAAQETSLTPPHLLVGWSGSDGGEGWDWTREN